MKTKIIKLYKFEELSKEAQAITIEKNYNINVDNDYWYEGIIDDWKEDLEKLGYFDPEIHFSGFWSQGDGAVFTAGVDIPKYIEEHDLKMKRLAKFVEGNEEPEIAIERIDSGYSHKYTARTDYNLLIDLPKAVSKQLESLLEIIENERLELCDSIYRDLEKEYVGETSEEAIKETLVSNDYYFLAEGGNIQE